MIKKEKTFNVYVEGTFLRWLAETERIEAETGMK